ncbi:hypothetical protein BAE44_0010337 [Dichanthelium oligosanthes]|uniref:DUF4220 domain-containing protein n=1 Tax=Dichanthelium oligosanthes TaxID=888268 RepID=A0A1E5VU96_9POAL|nr:hypothetical protein BAE44_0010337 [Dichanthelium oligosanthes]
MAGAEQMMYVWKEWGIQMLVLLSFTLQVMLLVLAEFRRNVDSGVLRAFLWSAYMLADSTAIYVLGHLSVTSRSPKHQLMAFWAPFLLLHLGGQDNITAYAIEDNRLWLRHVQTLVVQVAAAAYILHESSIVSNDSLLRLATILMFVVGLVKYGGRVWVLRCAGSSPSGRNYRSLRRPACLVQPSKFTSRRDTESLLLIAHLLLDVPKELLKGPLPDVVVYDGCLELGGEDVYKVVEMQLSLMHDVFYTKAEVMHSWFGLCIHIISLLGTSMALWQFYRLRDHLEGYGRADTIVTYVLLVGAVVLEIFSLLRAMFSSWTYAYLVKRSTNVRGEVTNVWNFLGRLAGSLRRFIKAAEWRRSYWSGSMGQHNMLQLCARSRTSQRSKIARSMGVEDPWNTLAYSGSIPVSMSIKNLVVGQVLKSKTILHSSPYNILNSRGQGVLKRWNLYDDLAWSVDTELEESILIWHIATDVYLGWLKDPAKPSGFLLSEEDEETAKAIETLSNYMLFLLATRPYMLHPPSSRNAYVEMCYGLRSLKYRSAEDLAKLLLNHGNGLIIGSRIDEFVSTVGDDQTLQRGSRLGAQLIGEEIDLSKVHLLHAIAQVWVEMLCYVGCQCSAYSHAKQLSNGGEFITIAALLVEYIIRRNIFMIAKEQASSQTNNTYGPYERNLEILEQDIGDQTIRRGGAHANRLPK